MENRELPLQYLGLLGGMHMLCSDPASGMDLCTTRAAATNWLYDNVEVTNFEITTGESSDQSGASIWIKIRHLDDLYAFEEIFKVKGLASEVQDPNFEKDRTMSSLLSILRQFG